MRHQVAGKKLNRSKDHRKALIKNLVKSLYEHERIMTTKPKAQAARRSAEKMITLAKHGLARGKDVPEYEVHTRRLAAARLGDKALVVKLFEEIAPRYEERAGGYTRILKMGPRPGDGAEMVVLELVE